MVEVLVEILGIVCILYNIYIYILLLYHMKICDDIQVDCRFEISSLQGNITNFGIFASKNLPENFMMGVLVPLLVVPLRCTQ